MTERFRVPTPLSHAGPWCGIIFVTWSTRPSDLG